MVLYIMIISVLEGRMDAKVVSFFAYTA